MKLEFVSSVTLGFYNFNVGDIIELNDEDPTIRELNDMYYILIYKGIRFDLHKESVRIIEDK
jgi:hypothetical protein